MPVGSECQAVLWEQEPEGVRVVSPHLGPQRRWHGQPGGPDLWTHAVAAGQADCLLWGAACHSHGGQWSALDWVFFFFLRWHFSVSVAEFLCQSVSHDVCLLQYSFFGVFFLLAILFVCLVCACVCMHVWSAVLLPFTQWASLQFLTCILHFVQGRAMVGVEKLRFHWHHLCLGDIISVSALPLWLALLVRRLACVRQWWSSLALLPLYQAACTGTCKVFQTDKRASVCKGNNRNRIRDFSVALLARSYFPCATVLVSGPSAVALSLCCALYLLWADVA